MKGRPGGRGGSSPSLRSLLESLQGLQAPVTQGSGTLSKLEQPDPSPGRKRGAHGPDGTSYKGVRGQVFPCDQPFIPCCAGAQGDRVPVAEGPEPPSRRRVTFTAGLGPVRKLPMG